MCLAVEFQSALIEAKRKIYHCIKANAQGLSSDFPDRGPLFFHEDRSYCRNKTAFQTFWFHRLSIVIPLFLAVTHYFFKDLKTTSLQDCTFVMVKIRSSCHKLITNCYAKFYKLTKWELKACNQPELSLRCILNRIGVINLKGLTRCYYLFKKLKRVFAPIEVQKQLFSFII